MNRQKVIAIYESGPSGRAWKGERTAELLEKLGEAGLFVVFLGLRGLLGRPLRIKKTNVCILFATPGLVSRLAVGKNVSKRDVRSRTSQAIFSFLLRIFGKTTVITQTTLGRLIGRLKERGHIVYAECDMTCPRAWRHLLLEEARRIGATEEIVSELPSRHREFEELRAFEYADKIVMLSSWAAERLPIPIHTKAVVIPSISVKPEPQPLEVTREACSIEFLFVGQLGFRKGVHVLIEAMQELDEKRFQCHAFGSLRDNFRQYMDRTGLKFPSAMINHGPGNWRNLIAEKPRRYVAVLPSFVEGSPRFIHEAAAMGIPAIVTPAACPSFLKDLEDALIISRPEAKDLRQAMLRIVDEVGLWERLSATTHSVYSRTYQETSYGKQMTQLLTKDDT